MFRSQDVELESRPSCFGKTYPLSLSVYIYTHSVFFEQGGGDIWRKFGGHLGVFEATRRLPRGKIKNSFTVLFLS